MGRTAGMLLASVLFAGAVGAQSDAYRISNNSIVVDRISHWQNWEFQNDRVNGLKQPLAVVDAMRVSAEGVQPTFYRRKINAAADAERYSYPDLVRAAGAIVNGGAGALSNNALAPQVLDEDLSTYWEPAAPANYEARLRDPRDFLVDNLRNWEVTVDLGRLIYADSITVIFPSGRNSETFLGQPGKAFTLWASMGERFPFPLGTSLKFSVIGQAAVQEGVGKAAAVQQGNTGAGAIQVQAGQGALVPMPGTEGRYLQSTFHLTPLDRADFDLDGIPDISGSPVHYVRLTFTDSDLWRETFIGAGDSARAVYEGLSPEQRGALVYQRQTAGGFLVEIEDELNGLTARERYLSLPPEKQGSILYYTREVPRVAEIQVWAKGDNYALRPEQRAGSSFEHGGLGAPNLATDGVYDSEWQANTWSPIYLKGTAWFDLGAVFWVDNLFLVDKRINQSHSGAFLGHFILVSDGTLLKPITMESREDFPQLENGLDWDNIVSENQLDNHNPVARIVNENFPLRKVRYVMLRDIDITGSSSGQYGSLATLGELQLYGEGYPVSVWTYSPPIQLTDSRGNFIRKTMPRILWEGDAVIRRTDPVTGRSEEVIEPLQNHPEVRLQIQTRTSDQTDSTFKYYEVVTIEGNQERGEVTKENYDDLVFRWAVWNYWAGLKTPHATGADDDKDGSVDEDEIDLIDNDGDGKTDEDGKKLGAGRKPKSEPAKEGTLAFVGWSNWSQSYLPTNGLTQALITSPNPRKFLQIRVNLVSEDPFKTARIRSLRVDLAPPLSLELAGEVARLNAAGADRSLTDLTGVLQSDYAQPIEIDPLAPQLFSYFIRAAGPDPADSEVRQGFDELLITAPRAAVLRGVRVGQVQVTTSVSPLDPTGTLTGAVSTTFSSYYQRDLADGRFKNAAGQVLDSLPAGTDSLYLRLPVPLNRGFSGSTHALAEVQFETQVLKEGEEFLSFIRSSASPDAIFQRVDVDNQDASELVSSNTVQVSLRPLEDQLVHDVALDRVFTPNGDGVNDEVRVRFTLLKVLTERPVGVSFYDLQGRLAGSARAVTGATADGQGKVGTLEFAWDGRNAVGQLAPPGIYLCRISVDADQGSSEQVQLVHVVY
ncbi:MAG: hypothetical protein FJY95_01860 [Candidatus Handelsmanbacteria bacterium]|nr:hypothetical protein [Candidatus Handelsmanbacteria bacterium]